MDSDSTSDKSPEQIEAEIERTRERISSDIDAISYKLSPQRLRERAQETLHDAQEVVMSTVHDVTQAVSDQAKETSSSFFDLVKENPLPAALIGLGVGLLVAGGAAATGSRQDFDDYENRYREGYGSRAPGLETTPSDYAATYGSAYDSEFSSNYGEGRMSGSSRSRGLNRWVEEQPLAVGIIGLLLGAAVGLGMPGTRYENRVMGVRSDEIRDRAKSVVHDAVDVVKETAREARNEAQQQLEERGVSVEGAKQAVAQMGQRVGQEVKDAAKEVADSAKETAKHEADKRGMKPETPKDEATDF